MNFDIIYALLQEKKYQQIRDFFKTAQVADIAEFLDELDPKTALLLFRLLPKEIAADVFSYLSPDQQSEISMLVNERELTVILDDLYFDDKIDFLEEMPANVVKRILKNASETERRLINQFLNYPENSAGSLMTIELVDLKKEMMVPDALNRIRSTAPDKETIYTCYAIDAQRHLEGTVSLKDLVLAGQDKRVADIMQKDPICVHTHEDQEDIADLFKKYDLLSVPVVDQESRLVGIITIDDVVDVIERENTEDFHRMAALQPSTEDYLSAGIFSLARKRIAWLMILMVSATFTGYIIEHYEIALQSAVALAIFIPMLMDTGGNAGAQASTLVIRSIALGEVAIEDIFRVIWKEIRVSVLVGTVMAVINFLRILYINQMEVGIALTVSITLLLTVVMAKVIGGILPLLAKQIKVDPAIMASPLITTIVDALALIIYFSLAVRLMGIA